MRAPTTYRFRTDPAKRQTDRSFPMILQGDEPDFTYVDKMRVKIIANVRLL